MLSKVQQAAMACTFFALSLLWFYQFACIYSAPDSGFGRDYERKDGWTAFYEREVGVVADLKTRLTGSENHTIFIDYLERELQKLGLHVQSDEFTFEYNAAPLSELKLVINNKTVSPSSYVPYSGNTDDAGVSGRLVKLALSPLGNEEPDWAAAAGNIALIDLYTGPVNGSWALPVWPGSDVWPTAPGLAANSPAVRGLAAAAAAGVKGVVYNWVNATPGNTFGQYAPFKTNYQGTPAVYVTSKLIDETGAANGSIATLVSTGKLTKDVRTRTLYTVIEGTDLKHESVIISTHTDGSNAVEENGHIGLLAKARELARSKPRRTHVLVFLTGHFHTSGFTESGRVQQRWLEDHPELWAGNTSSALKAVFASCVEHLGALHWREDLAKDMYFPTGEIEDESLWASTPELASLLGKVWRGAKPGVLRVINPNATPVEQAGEGLPLNWHNIPSVSVVTAPDWILKVWPSDFDERQLMDVNALRRQVESFLRVWKAVEDLTVAQIGKLNYSRVPDSV